MISLDKKAVRCRTDLDPTCPFGRMCGQQANSSSEEECLQAFMKECTRMGLPKTAHCSK